MRKHRKYQTASIDLLQTAAFGQIWPETFSLATLSQSTRKRLDRERERGVQKSERLRRRLVSVLLSAHFYITTLSVQPGKSSFYFVICKKKIFFCLLCDYDSFEGVKKCSEIIILVSFVIKTGEYNHFCKKIFSYITSIIIFCCTTFQHSYRVHISESHPSLGQFHQHFTNAFFCTKVCSKPNSKERKAAQKTFVQKMCT